MTTPMGTGTPMRALDDRAWVTQEVPSGPPGVRVGPFDLRRWVATALAVVVIAGVPLSWSFAHALTVPGGGSLGARTADWVRSMGGSRLIAWMENTYYSHHPPPAGGTPSGPITRAFVDPSTVDPEAFPAPGSPQHAPPPAMPIVEPALAGEGRWQPLGRLVGGAPAMEVTYLRPDAVHTSLVAGVVWMDPGAIDLRLVAGSQQPGGSGWADQAPLPADERPRLLATFNGGFRLPDGRGGYYEDGKTGRPLVDGAASLVIERDATVTVGKWGRDVTMTASVAAVRQNLSLIVDGGLVTPEVSQDSNRLWGATLRNEVLVWRSGVGVTRQGGLLYAAGPGLSVQSLADVLRHAGAVRAMELDINSSWVAFVSYRPAAGAQPEAANGAKLLGGMSGNTSRYLGASTRDFFAVLARPGADLAPGPSPTLVPSPVPSTAASSLVPSAAASSP